MSTLAVIRNIMSNRAFWYVLCDLISFLRNHIDDSCLLVLPVYISRVDYWLCHNSNASKCLQHVTEYNPSSNNKTLNARLLARVITDAITRNGAAAEIFCAHLQSF